MNKTPKSTALLPQLSDYWVKRCEKWASAVAVHGGGHTIHTTRWTELNETFHKA